MLAAGHSARFNAIGVIRLRCPCEREGKFGGGVSGHRLISFKGGLAMRKLLIALAALTAVALTATFGFGSSHREAPGTSQDPTADNTDTYAWTAKDAPGSLTVAADWIGGEGPGSGPDLFRGGGQARDHIPLHHNRDRRP